MRIPFGRIEKREGSASLQRARGGALRDRGRLARRRGDSREASTRRESTAPRGGGRAPMRGRQAPPQSRDAHHRSHRVPRRAAWPVGAVLCEAAAHEARPHRAVCVHLAFYFFLTFRNCTFSSIPVRPQIGVVVPWCCARSGSLSRMRDPALETLRCARAARAISPTGFIPVDTRRSISHTMGTRSDAVAPPFLRKVYVWPAGKETLRRWRRFSRTESNGAPETDPALDADRPQVSHRG